MATGTPSNVVLPKNLSTQSTATTISCNTINIPDETKNHVIVGIAMMNVLVPELKKYIDLKMKTFYDQLVKKYKINSADNSLYPEEAGYKFEYRKPIDDPKNFNIKSHHDLAKLFLKDFMTKFDKITDDAFDASAALTIIGKETVLKSKDETMLAKQLSSTVRNEWAHPNMANWTNMKYLDSFKLMVEIANALPEPKLIRNIFDKKDIVTALTSWRDDGLKLIGKFVDPALLKKVFKLNKNTHYGTPA